MPRYPRYCPVGVPVHVIQRGNNRQIIFTSDKDIAAYANWLKQAANKYKVHIHGWVFMTNHVHLLLTPLEENSVSLLSQYLGRLYVRYFNYTYIRSGTLFEGRFKSSLVQEEEYFLSCLRYIELNPVRAGIVSNPGDYKWSSYRMHGFGLKTALWNPHPLYISLGNNDGARQKAYRKLMRQRLNLDLLDRIRRCANKGQILGSKKFIQQIKKQVN